MLLNFMVHWPENGICHFMESYDCFIRLIKSSSKNYLSYNYAINESLKMMIIMRNKIKKFNRMLVNNMQNHKLIIRKMIMIMKLTDYDKRMKMIKI